MNKTHKKPKQNRSLEFDPFDVIIVGGGAVGCALAWESASRGLRVLLLEQGDFGAATSANSLSIVHGGLRYLQHLNLRRARASSRERSILLRIAPHLVSPLECAIPTTRSIKRGRLAFAIGLGVNRFVMAGQNRNLTQSQRLRCGGILSAKNLKTKVPGLSMEAVTGAAYWDDGCMRSGERLALAFVQSAHKCGATVLNHVAVDGSLSHNGRITGVVARDRLDGDRIEFRSKVVFDCRGVGIAAQPDLFGAFDIDIEFIKAVNIVISARSLGCAVGAPTRDARGAAIPGRLIFARPAGRTTVVGTWYFEHRAPDGGLRPEEEEEILGDISGAFPGWQVTHDDIVNRQVGYLPRNKSITTELLPIDHPLVIESSKIDGLAGLWHVQTEKWTTVRALAAQLVTAISAKEGMVAGPSRTHEQLLCGGEALTLTADQEKLYNELSDAQSLRLSTHYGGRAAQVLDHVLANPDLAESLPFDQAIIKGEVPYVIENEFVRTPEDLLRRLSPGHLEAPSAAAVGYVTQVFDAVAKTHDTAAGQTPI